MPAHRTAVLDAIGYLRAKAAEVERGSPLGGPGPSPEPCIAYPPGATEEQKLCMDQACAVYLVRWIGCGAKLDPPTCRDLIYQDYVDAVNTCLEV